MPEGSTTEDTLRLLESVAKLGHKQRADKLLEEKSWLLDLTKMTRFLITSIEMRMAELMSQQEASGFADMDAATRVRAELQQEFDNLTKITSIYVYAGMSHLSGQTRRRVCCWCTYDPSG